MEVDQRNGDSLSVEPKDLKDSKEHKEKDRGEKDEKGDSSRRGRSRSRSRDRDRERFVKILQQCGLDLN